MIRKPIILAIALTMSTSGCIQISLYDLLALGGLIVVYKEVED